MFLSAFVTLELYKAMGESIYDHFNPIFCNPCGVRSHTLNSDQSRKCKILDLIHNKIFVSANKSISNQALNDT